MKDNNWIKIVSETFDEQFLLDVLRNTKAVQEGIHVQYPAIPEGAHLSRFFDIEEAVKHEKFIPNALYDMDSWVDKVGINIHDVDVIFAPNQTAVRKIVEAFVSKLFYTAHAVFWEYLPTGKFGDKVVSGEIKHGDRVLVYNAVSIQGRCIGERLPYFVEQFGGEVVAVACFAKGTTPKIREIEKKWGNRFYSVIQVDIPVYKSSGECTMCWADEPLVPWTDL